MSNKLRSARDCGQAILEAAAEFGFSPPAAGEAPKARALAAGLMDHEVASVETIRSILAIQPASSLVFRERGEVTGTVATLLLKGCAEPDLAAGRFDGLTPAGALLGQGDEEIGLYYIWGVAGATKRAKAAAMLLTRRLRYEALAELVAYTFAATPLGRQAAISQVGFRPLRHPDDDLLVSDPICRRWAA